MKKRVISVIGLGYVGLPVSVAFSEAGYHVIGLDLKKDRVSQLNSNFDKTNEISKDRLKNCNINFTVNPRKISEANFHIVTVPTPIDDYNKPDFNHIKSASELLGKTIKKNDIVVYESTVYPGATEEIAVPIIEKRSGNSNTEYEYEVIQNASDTHSSIRFKSYYQ